MPTKTVAGRWLRHTTDGTIYGYSDLLAANPLVAEVSEEEAFPEKFIPAKQQGRRSRIALDGAVVPVEVAPVNEELAREVTADIEKKSPEDQPLERAREGDGTYKADDPATPTVNEAFVEGKPPAKRRRTKAGGK